MPRKDNDYDDAVQPVDEIVPVANLNERAIQDMPELQIAYEASPDLEPIVYGAEMQKYGFGFPMVKATDTVDRRVVITAYKFFESAFEGQKYAAFCRCYYPDTLEQFNCVYGGKAIMEMLMVLFLKGNTQPISFIPQRKLSSRGMEYWYMG